MVSLRDIAINLWCYRALLTTLIVPILLSPLCFAGQTSQCGFLMLVMGVFWCSEIIPLSMTALLPVVFLPVFEIMTTAEVCSKYMASLLMLMIGGVLMALAIEKCDLHRRIAIKIVMLVGTKPQWLMIGFMLPSWFMSMWINNTAAAAMMVPIIDAVMQQLKQPTEDAIENGKDSGSEEVKTKLMTQVEDTNSVPEVKVISGDAKQDPDAKCSLDGELTVEALKRKRKLEQMEKGFLICVAYGCNTGGAGTLTGTPPNLVAKNFADDLWLEHGIAPPIDFGNWMGYGLPMATISAAVVWLWLQVYFIGWRTLVPCLREKEDTKQEQAMAAVLKREYVKLGPLKRSEILVIIMFVFMVALWFFRNPAFMPGWASSFAMGYVNDAVPAVFIAVFLFVIPGSFDDKGQPDMLMDWDTTHKKFPWSLIFLIGGGFALAAGSKASGLSALVGEQLSFVEQLPPDMVVLVTSAIASVLTQIMSNTATATLCMPIMATVSESIGKSPLFLMLPVAVTCSFAYVLPVSTPPNAMVYATGKLSIADLFKAGIVPNLVCLIVVFLCNMTMGSLVFDLHTVPWQLNNSTVAAAISNATTTLPL